MENQVNKKYKLTNETIKSQNGEDLYRIEALKSFGEIKKGDKGGFVEGEKNLSHEGNCWVYDDAQVIDQALISENAKIKNTSKIKNEAEISGNAIIKGNSTIEEWAIVGGDFVGDSVYCDQFDYIHNADDYENGTQQETGESKYDPDFEKTCYGDAS